MNLTVDLYVLSMAVTLSAFRELTIAPRLESFFIPISLNSILAIQHLAP